MKSRRLAAAAAGLLSTVACATMAPAGAETLNYGRFGDIDVLRPDGKPRSVTILVSGRGGSLQAEAELEASKVSETGDTESTSVEEPVAETKSPSKKRR